MIQSFIKTTEVLIAIRVTSQEAIRDAIIQRQHPPIPAPSRVEVFRATHHKHYLETRFIKQG
jgi:hypothetical protein